MTDKFYSVEKVSETLGIHPKTIRRYITEGKLRATKVGKQYRISGHALSVFVESRSLMAPQESAAPDAADRLTVSAVADIIVRDDDEADRISSMLLAVMNTHDPLFDKCTLKVQQAPGDKKLRAMLWGSARFVVMMLDCIEAFNTRNE